MENFIITHHEISKKCKKEQTKKVARSGARTLAGRLCEKYIKRKQFFEKKLI